jgi:pimeloyl-ACP methyl ester carboxylesterase
MSTDPNGPHTRDLTLAAGARMHVIEAGEPDAPSFLLVHGYPQSAAEWLGVMAAADGQARMVAVDLPGIGGSPAAPGGGSKVAIADLLHRLIETLELKDTTLVGHDAGGMVAYAYLRRHGDVKRVAILETVIPGVGPWQEVIRNPYIWHFAFHSIPELPEILVQGHQARYFDYFFDAPSADRSRITPQARATYAAAYASDAALSAGFDLYQTLAQDAKDNAASAAAEPVATPLLYVRGGVSPVAIDAYLDGLRRAGVQNVQGSVIPDAGHFLADEQPDALWTVLREFAER